MGARRKAREAALQVLYQIEMTGSPAESAISLFWREHPAVEEVQKFAQELVEGTLRSQKEIDQLLERHSTHWRLSRMAVVDRNLLRMAIFELLYGRDVPVSVTLNEAIEIAKKFGTEESAPFINGVLDPLAKEVRTNDSLKPHGQVD